MIIRHDDLSLAHLFFCAATILARPSALIVRRFVGGSPRFKGAMWPASSARICFRRMISASIPCTIASRSMARV